MPLDLHYVDEVIRVRKELHGGGRGAPPLVAHETRAAASLNRSCVVLLSSVLQAYVEEIYKEEARQKFPSLQDEQVWSSYWRQQSRWGNPSDINIKNLFLRLGIPDVLYVLAWQKIQNGIVRTYLRRINELRNGIAHGRRDLVADGRPFNLNTKEVERMRNFAKSFGDRFEDHVRAFR